MWKRREREWYWWGAIREGIFQRSPFFLKKKENTKFGDQEWERGAQVCARSGNFPEMHQTNFSGRGNFICKRNDTILRTEITLLISRIFCPWQKWDFFPSSSSFAEPIFLLYFFLNRPRRRLCNPFRLEPFRNRNMLDLRLSVIWSKRKNVEIPLPPQSIT